MLTDSIAGCLCGVAVGDAIALPFEGMGRSRVAAFLGENSLEHRLIFGRGLFSDDTEHSLMIARSLLRAEGDAECFEKHFLRELRRWMLQLPAGVGMATARACLKLIMGFPASRSGVNSAGNGPAMRSGVLGLMAHSAEQLKQWNRVQTQLTHTHPMAELASYSIALATRFSALGKQAEMPLFLDELKAWGAEQDQTAPLFESIQNAVHSVEQGQSTEQFCQTVGLGKQVGGYVLHGLPVVIQCWLSHPEDYETAMETIVRCGGDTDTNAAMLGAIVGARVKVEGIPSRWREGICDWPLSMSVIEQTAENLKQYRISGEAKQIKKPAWLACLCRNLLFLAIVLMHGFGRLLPPYSARQRVKVTS